MNISKLICGLFVVLCVISCNRKKDIEKEEELNDYINNISLLPEPKPAHDPILLKEESTPKIIDGVEQNCTRKTYSVANVMDNVIAINPNSGSLYPGSIVQGKFLPQGQLNSIGDNIPRTPITITIDNYGLSKTIENPSNATISAGITELVNSYSGATKAKLNFKKSVSYSLEQGLLSLGVNVEGGIASLKANFSKVNSVEKQSVFMTYYQEYYTVSINQPTQAADFFETGVSIGDLGNKVGSDNPLSYVSSVSYGRLAIVKISSTSSLNEINQELEARFKIINGSTQNTSSVELKDSEVSVYVDGGNSEDANQINDLESLSRYINNGANFSPSSLGTPIAYVVKYASTNETIKTGSVVEYTIDDNCSVNEEKAQKLTITFNGFDIVNDCDGNSRGDFTYNLELHKNGVKIGNQTVTSEIDKSDGEYIAINKTFSPFYIPKTTSDQKVSIEGNLWEHDWGVESLGTINEEYTSPWSDLEIGDNPKTVVLDKGNDCRAIFYYNVKREE